MEKARAHLIISGRVQGVCFRMLAEETAKKIGITGWVRNTDRGTVEVIAEGDKDLVEKMVAWCHKGPPAARVDKVELEWEPFHGDMTDFRTARSD
jgi:acylphosphatase